MGCLVYGKGGTGTRGWWNDRCFFRSLVGPKTSSTSKDLSPGDMGGDPVSFRREGCEGIFFGGFTRSSDAVGCLERVELSAPRKARVGDFVLGSEGILA